MSLTKFFLGLAGGVVALAAVALLLLFAVFRGGIEQIERLTDEDPEAIAAAAGEIATFEVPAGYHPDYTAEFLDYTIVAYRPDDPHSHLMLVQAPAGTDVDELRAAAEKAEVTPAHSRAAGAVIDTPELTIAGQRVQAVVTEGVNGEGFAYRQISAIFDGRGGPALVTVTEPVSRWEWVRVNRFLESIR
jgi:hypothetical protein